MDLVCPSCGATNRVPDARLDDQPVCGRCKSDLMGSDPVALDDSSFDRYIAGTGLPVLVDFWAAWCGPCKAMAPQFAAAAQQLPHVRFAKVDTDAAQGVSSRMGIRSIPTLALFKNGRDVGRLSGAMSAGDLVRWVQVQLARSA